MEKRFTIQSEAFAQNRVEALREAIKELQLEYPEIISATFFGSLSKGKSTPESDIDAVLYIDADIVAEKERAEGKSGEDVIDVVTDATPLSNGLKTQLLSLNVYLRPDLYKKYNKLTQDKILELDPGLTHEQVEHIRSLPMSEKSLVKLLDNLIDSKNLSLNFDRKILEIHKGDMNKEELLKTAVVVGGEPDKLILTPTLLLGSMFHMDVGGGIRKYRKILLDKLSEAGPAGEEIWRDIIKYTERWEQKVEYTDLPTTVRYPRRLAEAVEVYGNMKNINP
jgi:hypothetical protein